MSTLPALTFVVAVAAGIRGIWSPCGLSMLSTITPIGERGRGNRYARTAAWYIVGAVVGGVTLGALAAAGALGLGPDRMSPGATAGVVALAALVVMASDADLGGFRLPYHRRQVNERWLDRYRPWVYGAGFGWQIGTGLCTYVMTAANYLLVLLAVLNGSAAVALWSGGVFGATRGLAVLLTRGVRTPDALRALHERIQAAGPRLRDLVLVVEAAVAVVAASYLGAAWAAGAAAAGLLVILATGPQRRRPACDLDDRRTSQPTGVASAR